MAEDIEREAVLEKLCSDCVDGCTRHCAEYTMLKYFPATDVRPVVRGKWEIYFISMLDGEGCKCSECGFEGVPYWDYCPNCGARMEES